ncbi:MAG TPA: hypothetical protein VF771_17075 [Longimicrobiaceae bacterium]
MRRRALRLALVLLLPLPLQACTYWGGRPLPEPGGHEYIVGTVRVLRTDGTEAVLDNVSVRPDSVSGMVHGLPGQRFAVPIGQVRSLAIRRENSLGTVAVALAACGAALFLWGYVVIATQGSDS